MTFTVMQRPGKEKVWFNINPVRKRKPYEMVEFYNRTAQFVSQQFFFNLMFHIHVVPCISSLYFMPGGPKLLHSHNNFLMNVHGQSGHREIKLRKPCVIDSHIVDQITLYGHGHVCWSSCAVMAIVR